MNDNFYVFYLKEGDSIAFYERTCGTEEAAQRRVEELKKKYHHAEYFEDHIPEDYEWLY
jgi:hypothetical protein